MDPATGKWLASSAKVEGDEELADDRRRTTTSKMAAGPPRPIPTPKLPNEPVETLMKAERDREVRQEAERALQLAA